jgi:catechol 2,3-dioxygenase-like lactoylglutathione lyase family enzyme
MSHPVIDQQVTFLYTSDLSTTAHFYEKILGLSLSLDQDSCRIYRVSNGAFLGFCEQEVEPKQQSEVILTLTTPEVDHWYKYLSKHDVDFEKVPSLNTDSKIYHCFLRDPNGYLIEIQRVLN